MAHRYPVKKRKASPIKTLFKTIYWTVFALSLLIVVGYVAFSAMVHPPAISSPMPPDIPALGTSPDGQGALDGTSQGDQSMTYPQAGLIRREDCHTFLLMGCDDGNGNADTIMAVTYDVKNQRVVVASVPRDTLVDVSRTVKKINAAYGAGGVAEVQRELSTLLGYPVDHYIKVDLRAFQAVVDAVDGVDFQVPMDMDYDDPTQDLHIHLSAGMQHLDGAKALQLVRFRSGYANADIGRIQTQQKFLTALAKKILSWQSVTKINEFVEIFSQYVDTDLTVGNLAYFGIAALELDTSTGLTLSTLPGDGTVSYLGIPYYYELEPQATLDIINNGLNPYTQDITQDMAHIFQVP